MWIPTEDDRAGTRMIYDHRFSPKLNKGVYYCAKENQDCLDSATSEYSLKTLIKHISDKAYCLSIHFYTNSFCFYN